MKKGHKASMTQAKNKRRPGRIAVDVGIALLALGATIGIAACGGAANASGSIDLVAYSTTSPTQTST
jgi:hypothetical protein